MAILKNTTEVGCKSLNYALNRVQFRAFALHVAWNPGTIFFIFMHDQSLDGSARKLSSADLIDFLYSLRISYLICFRNWWIWSRYISNLYPLYFLHKADLCLIIEINSLEYQTEYLDFLISVFGTQQ